MTPLKAASGTGIWVLLCVSIPSFMISLDANIVAVSLPSIAQSLRADFSAIEWVISAYTLTFATMMLPAGTLADKFGRKRLLMSGLAIFTAASLVCGAAPSALVLNLARAVQGVGAALQLSAALAILSFEFQGAARAKAFAFWGSVIGIAITLGPVVGGVITQTLGWEWAFYINIPVGIVMIVLTAKFVKESRDPGAKELDVGGFLSFSGALGLLTFALISGNHQGWTDPRIVSELIAAFLLFAGFVAIEARHSRPMLDISYFRIPTYIGANVAGISYAITVLTMLNYLPLYFQSVLGVSPQEAGLYMLPLAVPIFVMPRIIARHFSHRAGGRVMITAGLALTSIGLFLMSAAANSLDYWALLPGMLIIGVSAGILNGETAKVSMSVIPPERAGMAAGVGGTIRFAGLVVGFAALGAVLFNRVGAGFSNGKGPLDEEQLLALQRVVSGDHSAATIFRSVSDASHVIASGYATVFLVAATIALVAAALTWCLIASTAVRTSIEKNASAELLIPIE